MSERVSNLLKVKSIVTILLTVTFCVLSIMDKVGQDFMTVFTVVVAFYFGTQKLREGD